MKITDEQLSAFLDAELPESEMEMIREQLMDDENLANRLAELAMVDDIIAKAYVPIGDQPLPASVTDLLQKKQTAKVIPLPQRKKSQPNYRQYFSIAASVIMLAGFGLVIMTKQSASGDHWQTVAQALDNTPSGIEKISNGIHVKPRITFANRAGNYCRQFEMSDSKSATENIACRKDNQWQLITSVVMEKTQQAGTYQTASGGSLLDGAIEEMASGDFLDAQAEAQVMQQHWGK